MTGPKLSTSSNRNLNVSKLSNVSGIDAWQVCLNMKEGGVLAKQTHGTNIRLAPPLCITEQQLREGIDIIVKAVQAMEPRAAD
jgi:ornithine--oxo-acid transaminase